AVGVLVDAALGALLGQDQVGLEVCSRHHLVLLLLLAVTAASLTARTLRVLGLPGRALVRGVGFGGRLGRRLGVLHLGGIHVPGRALVGGVGVGGSLRLLGSLAGLLRGLAVLLGSLAGLLRGLALLRSVRALVVDHHASTSIGCGCWAACG